MILKTFREAGEVVLHLGLKYIWIDSLCIIQDDTEDWKVQAAQMCNIYSGAYLTIAATSSSDRDNGLFHTVSTIPISPVETSRSYVFIREVPSHMGFQYSVVSPSEPPEYPLLRRGWVYQERLLSPRFVHFTRREILLECSAQYEWNDLVAEYSALQLTYDSDTIPALAGIARHHATKYRDYLGRYVAGLWEKNLAQDLLWYVQTGRRSTRPEVSPAPSWSWASVTGEVGWLQCSPPTPMTTTAAFDEHLEVVSYHIELAGPDEFGPLQHAEMTVRGLLAKGSWTVDSGSSFRTRVRYHPDHNNGSSRMGGYVIYPDYNFADAEGSRRLEEGGQVFCLKTGFLGNMAQTFKLL
ncbi:HET domain-containing protein [Apiospora saccharicola]|uniref:HET domain-containing protein n=1 Tax=Apiospora saccharicola TaxID=335842 RepID=A0ABR1VBI2_9PEZI